MQKEPDITADMLKKIQAETLVLAGAHDLVEESDTRFIASCIPHASLRILQSESHGSYIVHDRRIGDLLLAYLNHARKGE
jgi:pimeloyl-ACP methyl ester carboxylesterase